MKSRSRRSEREEIATQAVINGDRPTSGRGRPTRRSEGHRPDPGSSTSSARSSSSRSSPGAVQDLEGPGRSRDRGQGRGSGHRGDHDPGRQAARDQVPRASATCRGLSGSWPRPAEGTIKATILDAPNKSYVMKEAPDKFLILPWASSRRATSALFASTAFLEQNQAAVAVLRREAPQGDPRDQRRTRPSPSRSGSGSGS